MSKFIKEMFRVGLYKSTQGKKTRLLTMLAVWTLFIFAAVRLYQMAFVGWPILNDQFFRGLIALLVALLGGWFAFRLVQFPPFADFLVSVEAEMIKVYWPPKSELISSTKVVLAFFVLLASTIFIFDIFWQLVFKWLKVLPW